MSEDRAPRVLLVSQRGHKKPLFRSSGYEFEDVIRLVDDTELFAPECTVSSRLPYERHIFEFIGRYTDFDIKRRARLSPPKLVRYYDMLFVPLSAPHELIHLEHMLDILCGHCRLAVCYIEELWPHGLKSDRLLRPLEKFDHILLGSSGTCEALSRALRKPVTYLPHGIDMGRFCPYPNPPRRTIDVYAMGRCSAQTHRALLEWAEQTGSTYLFDSISGVAHPWSMEKHRHLIASLIKRCRYFLVNPAKIDAPEETSGQQEVGPRFYEGAGAGAVLLGQSPQCSANFAENFDWPDAIIEMPFGTADVAELLSQLDAQPERIQRIQYHNVVNCLRRHDWVYRWLDALKRIGLEPSPMALQRQRHLQELAATIPTYCLADHRRVWEQGRNRGPSRPSLCFDKAK